MRKNLLLKILVSAFVLGCVQMAWAGVEPSPFCVRIVKLENVAMSLGGSNQMLALLLAYDRVKVQDPDDVCHPPDPGAVCHPPEPGLSLPEGCVITLNALAQEIRGLAKDVQRLEEAVYDVTKHPPEPGVPVDQTISRVLAVIKAEAITLMDQIDSEPPPDDNKVTNALAKLTRNAQSIINVIDAFKPPPDDQIPPGADL